MLADLNGEIKYVVVLTTSRLWWADGDLSEDFL